MTWLGRGIVLGLLAFIVLGPLANLVLWAAAEQWYFPHKLPVSYGTKFWEQVFKPRGDALASLVTSIWIALATVGACLALAVPAGYALARLKLPWRTAILLAFLMPQAFPSLAVYINIARIFYDFKLNGTMTGVILVHTVHGLVFAVWITAAAFAAVDRDLELAARNLGGSAEAYVDAFPGELVMEVHLAGHSADPALGPVLLVDSHDAPVAPEVWALYEHLIARIGPRPTLIERDGNLPAFAELMAERARAQSVLHGRFAMAA